MKDFEQQCDTVISAVEKSHSCVGTMGKRGQGPSWSHRSGVEEGVEITQVRDVEKTCCPTLEKREGQQVLRAK